MRRKTYNKYKNVGKRRAYMTPKELKQKAKNFYVYSDEKGFPIITTMFSIYRSMKCFNDFKSAYEYWLDQVEIKCPNTIIIEVDASTFFLKDLYQCSVAFSYRLIKDKKVILEKSVSYGTIEIENNRIGTYGIAELIGATFALKELDDINFDNVIIRYDNENIRKVAYGNRVITSELNADYVAEYVRTYKKIIECADVSFQHVYSHVGDLAHDQIDERAKNQNRELSAKVLVFA